MSLLGAALVAVTLVDLVRTTIAASEGRGGVSSRLTHRLWDAAVHLLGHRRQRHRALRATGMLIVVTGLASWIVMLWAGWTLVFAGTTGAVLEVASGVPAGFWQRAYFVGYAMSTMGNGDFVPAGSGWQVLTVVASLSGIAALTLVVTYLVPVVESVTARRRAAMQIFALGHTAESVVTNAWVGGWSSALARRLEDVASDLTGLANQHLAYPVVHYFHDVERGGAIAVATGVLDDAVTLLQHGVSPEHRPDPVTLRAVRSAVTALADALTSTSVRPADEIPAPPDLTALARAGIPTVTADHWHDRLDDLAERRRTLHGFVREDGWTWDAVRDPERTTAYEHA